MRGTSNQASSEARWLLLIHQLPPKPDYFRVKIWRRLRNLGAVAIKNAVYALPNTEQSHEDFQWITREIASGGGESIVCEARVIEGLSDSQIINLFHEARNSDYQQISNDAKAAISALRQKPGNDAGTRLIRLKRQFAGATAIDFFEASGRAVARKEIAALEAAIRGKRGNGSRAGRASKEHLTSGYNVQEYRGRTWVTRKGIHVDRIASAWLIRRFIDEQARFRFVSQEGYRPESGELRFDMFEAEFTHEGDRCTFEVLCERFGLADPALRAIADVVHDIDLKDSKYGREETPGISRLIAGISMNHRDDEVRLERGSAVFDDLYECFRRQPQSSRNDQPHRHKKDKK